MTIQQYLEETQVTLASAKIGTTKLDTLILLEFVTKKDRAWLMTHPEFELSTSQQKSLQGVVKKRIQGTAIAYLTGVKEFYGIELKVSPDVLIPRPETEELVEAALKIVLANARVLEIGTGSGAIALALAKNRPSWQITATDVYPAALAIARANAKLHHLKVEFIKSDLWQNPVIQQRWDIICANLPYLKDGAELSREGQQEPGLALRGGADGLDLYRSFFDGIGNYLATPGYIFIESDPWQHTMLIQLARAQKLELLSQERFALGFQTS